MDRVRSLKDLWFGLEGDSDVYDKPFGGPVVSLLLGRRSLYTLRLLSRLLDAPCATRRGGRCAWESWT